MDDLLQLIEEEEKLEKDALEKEALSADENVIKYESAVDINSEIKPMGFSKDLVYDDNEVLDYFDQNTG